MRASTGADLVCKFPSIHTDGPDGTAALGRSLAKAVFPGLLILLYGPLGAGKTLLSVSLGESLGAVRMKSPSFAVESIHPLPGKNFPLVHADLYRLDDASSETMQLEEYIDDGAIVLVEWAERWGNPGRQNRWDVRISTGEGTGRTIDLAVYGEDALTAFSAVFPELLASCR